jgi:hypothetical protein
MPRQATLVALATPAFGRSQRSAHKHGAFESIRLIPGGAEMLAQVTSVDVDPSQGNFDRGVATIVLALRHGNGPTDQPVTETFAGDLLLTTAGWRVADFTLQP